MRPIFQSMCKNLSVFRRGEAVSTAFSHPVGTVGTDETCLPFDEPAPLCTDRLRRLLNETASDAAPVILCIGTDRLIGDCLGPFLGTLLEKAAEDRLPVYGTLSNAVHALNLPEIYAQIKKKHPDRAVIAVDASLGSREQIGSVFVRSGSLRPGAGVRKALPEAGDISITGIVGTYGSQPYLNLQTVRLSTVAAMADKICGCILDVCLCHNI